VLIIRRSKLCYTASGIITHNNSPGSNGVPAFAECLGKCRHAGPGARPASYTMVTGSFPGLKRSGCGVDHPLPSSAVVKERIGLYF